MSSRRNGSVKMIKDKSRIVILGAGVVSVASKSDLIEALLSSGELCVCPTEIDSRRLSQRLATVDCVRRNKSDRKRNRSSRWSK